MNLKLCIQNMSLSTSGCGCSVIRHIHAPNTIPCSKSAAFLTLMFCLESSPQALFKSPEKLNLGSALYFSFSYLGCLYAWLWTDDVFQKSKMTFWRVRDPSCQTCVMWLALDAQHYPSRQLLPERYSRYISFYISSVNKVLAANRRYLIMLTVIHNKENMNYFLI